MSETWFVLCQKIFKPGEREGEWRAIQRQIIPKLARYDPEYIDDGEMELFNKSMLDITIDIQEKRRAQYDYYYAAPYYCHAVDPGEWYQVVYLCKDYTQFLKISREIEREPQDACGQFATNCSWIDQITTIN